MKKEKEIVEAAAHKVEQGNKLLVIIVNRGFADNVVEVARGAGAKGATILHGRGSAGVGEQFMGMSITPEKEIVLIVISDEFASAASKAITENFGRESDANGICFTAPISHLTRQK